MWGNIAFPYQKGNREMEEQRCISAKQFWCCKKRIITKWDISQTFNFTCGNEIACCKIHLPNFLTYLTWGLNKFSPMFVLKLYGDKNLDLFARFTIWCLSGISFSFWSQEQRLILWGHIDVSTKFYIWCFSGVIFLSNLNKKDWMLIL